MCRNWVVAAALWQFFIVPSSHAQTGTCVDSDGDGWGWDGIASCRVVVSTTPATAGECIDLDGDGWGWDGSMSCRVAGVPPSATPGECVDSDGDGWGWDGIESCRVNSDQQSTVEDEVYLLIGQSNMVGWSESGVKLSGPGQVDAKNPRIFQLNVARNDKTIYQQNSGFTDENINTSTPLFILAEDPLHEPLEPGLSEKIGSTIGPGLSFAKAALSDTQGSIYLVPAAFGGTGFCLPQFDAEYAWNAVDSQNVNFGGTGLADRALNRLNITLRESGGIFKGILWHQGVSDSSNWDCALAYADNLAALVARIRSEALVDALGPDARGDDAKIPFIVGTMSKSADERGDYSTFGPRKSVVDAVHRNISNIIPHSDWVNNDDLGPPAYPCGKFACFHFGALAYREMGARYYEALKRVLQR